MPFKIYSFLVYSQDSNLSQSNFETSISLKKIKPHLPPNPHTPDLDNHESTSCLCRFVYGISLSIFHIFLLASFT